MNILFILHGQCCPTVGGIERVTDVLVNELKASGEFKFYYLYQERNYDLKETGFLKSFYVPNPSPADIAEIISTYSIDVIINQEEHFISKEIYDAVKKAGRKCRIIYCLHSKPLAIASLASSFSVIVENWKKSRSFGDFLKVLGYPLYRYQNLNKAKELYRRAYCYSDLNILLSKGYAPAWKKIVVGNGENNGFQAKVLDIPNPSTFKQYASDVGISAKQKRVLMVCRLYKQKNVIEALKIWKEIEKDDRFNEWHLDIVGDGEERGMLEEYAAANLRRVVFHGRRNPAGYYEDASLFMLTSHTEGWAMTLVEAMQFGCVPISYNTYEALADVFPESYHENIIKAWDMGAYVGRLKELMADEDDRYALAKEGIKHSREFSAGNIVKRWKALLYEGNLSSK